MVLVKNEARFSVFQYDITSCQHMLEHGVCGKRGKKEAIKKVMKCGNWHFCGKKTHLESTWTRKKMMTIEILRSMIQMQATTHDYGERGLPGGDWDRMRKTKPKALSTTNFLCFKSSKLTKT